MCKELDEELTAGRSAAEQVAAHMEAMGAASTEWLIPTAKGMWRVSVELLVFESAEEGK